MKKLTFEELVKKYNVDDIPSLFAVDKSYDSACKHLLFCALVWQHTEPRKKPRFEFFFNEAISKNKSAKELEDYLLNVDRDQSGNMLYMVIVYFNQIKKFGFEKWKEAKLKGDKLE